MTKKGKKNPKPSKQNQKPTAPRSWHRARGQCPAVSGDPTVPCQPLGWGQGDFHGDNCCSHPSCPLQGEGLLPAPEHAPASSCLFPSLFFFNFKANIQCQAALLVCPHSSETVSQRGELLLSHQPSQEGIHPQDTHDSPEPPAPEVSSDARNDFS